MLNPLDLGEVFARMIVKRSYPLAYQDYLCNIWTDDLYECDSHCIVAAEQNHHKAWRARAREAWILAAIRVIEDAKTP